MTGARVRVEVLTARARSNDLARAEYREIYEDLRQGRSLDKFTALLQDAEGRAAAREGRPPRRVTGKASWSRYERLGKLTPAMADELRCAVGLGKRPAPVEDVLDIDPDAEVVRISDNGPAPATRVLLLNTRRPLTIHAGETVSVAGQGAGGRTSAVYTPRTRPVRAVSVPARVHTRMAAVRAELGVSWGALMERLLDAYERERAGARAPDETEQKEER